MEPGGGQIKKYWSPKQRWFLAGAALLGPYVLDRIDAPLWVAVSTFVLFLSAAALWSWIEAEKRRQYVFWAFATIYVTGVTGYIIYERPWQPPTRTEIIAELETLVSEKSWNELADRLRSIEENAALRDIGLYFRGRLYLHASAGPDPEQFLSLVPPDSSLYTDAQWLRLSNFAKAPTEQKARAIADSMDRAGFHNPVYYKLRLYDSRRTYSEVTSLYNDFEYRHRAFFDFKGMTRQASLIKGRYFQMNVRDTFAIPECLLLFLASQIWTAHHEGLAKEELEAFARYDKLVANKKVIMRMLYVDSDAIGREMEVIRAKRLLIEKVEGN